jgi:cytoskeleton protein RodZ
MAADADPAQERAPVGLGAGALLREARERAGLSIEAASTELLLKAHILEALEQDRLDQLPEPPFVRGYLRSYARLVGADEARVLERYEAMLPEQAEVTFSVSTTEPEDRGRLAVLALGSLAALAVVAILVWWLGSGDTVGPVVEPEPSLELQASEPEPEPVPVPEPQAVELEPAPAEATPQPPPVPVEPEAVVEPAETVAEPEPEPPPVESAPTALEPVEAAAGVTASALEPPDLVLVELSGDSWIEVYDAEGRRLLYGLEPAGAQHRLRGTRPFRVFLGNAPEVAVEINGRPFDLSPLVRRDNTARFTLQ